MTPATWRSLTQAVLLAAVVLLFVYNLVAFRMGGPDATISAVIHDAAVDRPVVAVLLGLLVGHWLWPIR